MSASSFVYLGEENLSHEFISMVNLILTGVDRRRRSHKGEEKKEEAPEVATLNQLVKEKKFSELLQQGLFNNLEKIFAPNNSESDIDAVFSLGLALLVESKIPADAFSALISKFTETLSKDPSKSPLLKIKLLCTLFNILPESNPHRPKIFTTVLQFCQASNQISLVLPHVRQLPKWLQQWNLQPAEVSELYLIASQLLRSAKQSSEADQFLYKYLRSLENQKNAAALADAKEQAASLVISVLSFSCSIDADLLFNLAAVKQLESDAKYGNAFTLLKIFVSGSVQDFLKFASSNKDYLASINCPYEKALQNMRVLALCSLVTEQQQQASAEPLTFTQEPGYRFSYDQIRQALAIESKEADDVEEAILQAVHSKKVDARIDQDQEQIVIRRAQPRNFSNADWAKIDTKIQLWKSALQNVMNSLHELQSRSHREDFDEME